MTLAQMAAHRGRMAAAGLAIVIGTAFVAATVLASGLLRGTVTAAVSASYRGADVVVTDLDGPLEDDVAARARGAELVAAAEGQRRAFVDLVTDGRSDVTSVVSAPQAPQLRGAVAVVAGELPAGPGGVAVDEGLADQLGLGVGDPVTVRWTTYGPAQEVSAPDGSGALTENRTVVRTDEVVVSGLLAERGDLTGRAGRVLGDPADVAAWSVLDDGGAPTQLEQVLVVGAEGTDPEQVRASVAAALGPGTSVLTAAQQTERTVDGSTGTDRLLTAVLLAFATVAVFVAGVVVTNTLAVLVAQRRRELALLRCVGATRGQVRRTVLLEAAVLGLVSSLAGVALGTALAQAAASVVGRLDLGFATPPTVGLSWASVLVPLVVGTGTTVVAALAPARAATRVAPLAALRPDLPVSAGGRAPVLRLALTALLVLSGGGLLVLGVVLGVRDDAGPAPLALGVLGGAVSFTGVLVGAPVLLPPVLRLLGWAAARAGGVPSRLAADNTARNPQRAAVTASALLIGVTLVTLMTVGTASVQATIEAQLDAEHPVDITVGGPGAGVAADGSTPALDPAVVAAVDGVAGSGLVARPLALPGTQASAPEVVPGAAWPVVGVDRASASDVVRDPALLAGLADGTVLVPRYLRGVLSPGQVLALQGPAGALEAEVVMTRLPLEALVVTPADLARLDPGAATGLLWVDVPEGGDDRAAVEAVQDAVATAAGTGPGTPVDGAAVQRGDTTQALDAMLGVVLGLLGVAVVIAVIGVSNTLSLSVIERTRESALLRAMGLTRGQLRRTLAVEGLLLAGVGALVGVVLGTGYGWAGTLAVFGQQLDTRLALPWERLGLVVGVALLAGLLASVLPARRAVRTPPAAALAE